MPLNVETWTICAPITDHTLTQTTELSVPNSPPRFGYRTTPFQFYKMNIEMDLAITFWISHSISTRKTCLYTNHCVTGGLKIRHSDLLVHMLWSGSGQSDKAAMSGHKGFNIGSTAILCHAVQL